jgi:D-alanyl-D-alanine carboxypeptidase
MFGVCGDIKGSDFEKNDQAYRSKVCAFSTDFNVVSIYARPAKKASQPAFIEVEPNVPNYIQIRNNVKTVGKGKVKPLAISVSVSGGKLYIDAKGEISVGAETKIIYRRAPDPFAFASESLKASLEAAGIKVTGKILKKRFRKTPSLFTNTNLLRYGKSRAIFSRKAITL